MAAPVLTYNFDPDPETIENYKNAGSVRDYIALLKPRVMTLVVFSGIAGMVAAPGDLHPFLWVIAILCLTIGAGSAGAMNMWYDRDIDAVMKRTRFRPIPSGKIEPENALAFAVVLNFMATTLMALAVNLWAAGVLLFATFFYAVIYTVWLKRSTDQNIVIGGAAGAFPPVIGWVAVTGDPFHILPWLMFLLIFLWTPPHFWALSLITSEDYKRAKIPMLPVTKGEARTRRDIVVYCVLICALSGAFWYAGYQNLIFTIGFAFFNVMFLLGGVALYIKKTKDIAKRLFAYSIAYLFLVFALFILISIM